MKFFFKRDHFCYSVLAALLLVSFEVESWALTLCLLFLSIRFGAERGWWKPLSSIWVNILSVAGLGLVFAQFRTLLGQEASSTLLVILASLRISDFRSERDERMLILLGFILVALKFLFSVDLYWFPIGGMIFLGLWRSLLPLDMEDPWKITFRAALKSFPVVAILFFVFPRVSVPWARTFTPPIPMSGLSESISPGDIADLTMSRQTVFRAEFVGLRPNMRDMYWRGAVLERGNGFNWNKTTELVTEIEVPSDDLAYDYVVTLEPSDLRILPALEHTRIMSSPMMRAVKTNRGNFKTIGPIISRIQYRGLSGLLLSGPTINNPTEVPELPEKTKAWVAKTLAEQKDFYKKLQSIKQLFTTNKFAYTRQPGTYSNLDEFLFDRKLGFCEHFAGSYATLARALGIPARVITGYQGGEWNEAGQFLRVSQADAHAWVEVRHPDGKWRRVDPTFWIAPLRIDLGGLTYFDLSPSEMGLTAGTVLQRLRGNSFISQSLNYIEYYIENINYQWTRAMLGFDIAEQQKILKIIVPRIGWWLASIVCIFLLFIVLKKIVHLSKNQDDQAIETYLWLERRLSELGFQREVNEPPLSYLEKVKTKRPGDEVLINKTIQLYRYERYRERKSGPDDWNRLKRAWKKRFAQIQNQNNRVA